MALLSLWLFLLPFHLLPPGAESNPQTHCGENFSCGAFSLEFPFTNALNPGCGPILVADCNSARPRIISSESAEDGYTILKKMAGNNFSVVDNQLNETLMGCGSFRNFSMPPPPLSFTFSPNITLFRCFNRTPDYLIDEFFKNYRRLYNCTSQCWPDPNPVCYGHPTDGLPDMDETRIPNQCSMIQLPMTEKPRGDPAHLSTWLTPNFTLELSIRPGCHGIGTTNEFDCHQGSGKQEASAFMAQDDHFNQN